MIEGVQISLGGKEYIVPALNFRQLRELKEPMSKLNATANGIPDDVAFDAGLSIIEAAIKRNYPDITREQVEEMIDLSNFKIILPAIMGASGLVKTSTLGEAVAQR